MIFEVFISTTTETICFAVDGNGENINDLDNINAMLNILKQHHMVMVMDTHHVDDILFKSNNIYRLTSMIHLSSAKKKKN